jgi:hypothetical protein
LLKTNGKRLQEIEAHHWKKRQSAVQIASSQYDTPHKIKVIPKRFRVKLPLFWLLFL